MNVDKPFFDTNVLLYLLAADAKADIAEKLLSGGGIVSVQVLNEFASTASRKLKMSWAEIRDVLTILRKFCDVVPITVEIHEIGLSIAERYRLSFYDSLICAAASDSGCKILYSEDMQHDQSIHAVTIRNPFQGIPPKS